MFGWNIVNFIDDNTVSVVPDTWLKKNTCAWPKDQKNSQNIIENRVQPNKNDFYFYSARRMSGKTYTSLDKAKSKLPKAVMKSDISNTEDETLNIMPKCDLKRRNLSSKKNVVKKVKLNSANHHKSSPCGPPQYKPVVKDITIQDASQDIFSPSNVSQMFNARFNVSDSNSDSSNSIINDLCKDRKWMKLTNNSIQEYDVKSPLKITPSKSLQSPVVIMPSPSGSWRVSPEVNEKNNPTNSNNSVKRQLQYHPVENKNLISDLHNISISSFSFLKYEIQALKALCHSMNENIEKIMNNASGTTTLLTQDIDIETLFPIKNNEDLLILDKINEDKDLRKCLVHKISLFVGKKDIRNSVRRIMARMFDDTFLIHYSMYGFKQKKSFANLPCYRLIIDALRVHVNYKTHTDKEIDEPMGIWLSHAPYRLLAASNKNQNT